MGLNRKMIVDKNNYSIEHFHNAPLYNSPRDRRIQRKDHMMFACDHAKITGEICEFGVYEGASLSWICSKFPDQTVYAFDSFEGLPEDWKVSANKTYRKGHFATNLDNLKSKYSHLKVSWEQGWFDQTVPEWINRVEPKQMKLINMDADLYSSTQFVLDCLNPYIVPGTVIVFDEMYPWGEKPHEYWEEHEFKALGEWIEKYDRTFEVICRTGFNQQASIKIIR